jgi:hypothetical protein
MVMPVSRNGIEKSMTLSLPELIFREVRTMSVSSRINSKKKKELLISRKIEKKSKIKYKLSHISRKK